MLSNEKKTVRCKSFTTSVFFSFHLISIQRSLFRYDTLFLPLLPPTTLLILLSTSARARVIRIYFIRFHHRFYLRLYLIPIIHSGFFVTNENFLCFTGVFLVYSKPHTCTPVNHHFLFLCVPDIITPFLDPFSYLFLFLSTLNYSFK